MTLKEYVNNAISAAKRDGYNRHDSDKSKLDKIIDLWRFIL